MSNNRRKGHDWERALKRLFSGWGFIKAKTTRATSQLLDSCKIDLDFVPWHIQAKNGYAKRRPKYDLIYRQIKEELSKNFYKDDPVHDKDIVLVHKMDNYKTENCTWTFSHDHIVHLLGDYFSLGQNILKLKKGLNSENMIKEIQKLSSVLVGKEEKEVYEIISNFILLEFFPIIDEAAKDYDDLDEELCYITSGRRGFNPILDDLMTLKKRLNELNSSEGAGVLAEFRDKSKPTEKVLRTSPKSDQREEE